MTESKAAPVATRAKKNGCSPVEKARYEGWGIPYCNKCCSPMATDADNLPICKLDDSDACPLIKKE